MKKLITLLVCLTLLLMIVACDVNNPGNDTTQLDGATDNGNDTTQLEGATDNGNDTTQFDGATDNGNDTTQLDGTPNNYDEHLHTFSAWVTTTMPSCTATGMQTRTCGTCGFSEYLQIAALSHIEVVDIAIPATNTSSGLTEGKHCSVCNTVIVAQKVIPPTNNPTDAITKEQFTQQFNIAKNEYISLLKASKTPINNQIAELEDLIRDCGSEYSLECQRINFECSRNGLLNSGYHTYLLNQAKEKYDKSVKYYSDQKAKIKEEIAGIDKEINNPTVSNILSILSENCGISKMQAQEYYKKYITN